MINVFEPFRILKFDVLHLFRRIQVNRAEYCYTPHFSDFHLGKKVRAMYYYTSNNKYALLYIGFMYEIPKDYIHLVVLT